MDYSKYDKYQNEREKKTENKPEEKPEILTLPIGIIELLDWEDKTELEHLPLGKQSEFLIKYQFAIKNKNTALLTSLIGCHYWYFGDWNTQILFWVTLGGFGLWATLDIFRISKLVDKYNKKLIKTTLNEVMYNLS